MELIVIVIYISLQLILLTTNTIDRMLLMARRVTYLAIERTITTVCIKAFK